MTAPKSVILSFQLAVGFLGWFVAAPAWAGAVGGPKNGANGVVEFEGNKTALIAFATTGGAGTLRVHDSKGNLVASGESVGDGGVISPHVGYVIWTPTSTGNYRISISGRGTVFKTN